MELQIENHGPPKLYIDEIQISQILVNLVSNAIDATADQDRRWVCITARETQDAVQFTVRDSGCGVEDSVLEKVFDPFFTTKDVGKGTGLGLSISKGIAEDHGGSLQYLADREQTTFVLTLPKKLGKVAS